MKTAIEDAAKRCKAEMLSEPKSTLMQQWKKALITNDDRMHHHKILGVLCLLSFAYRFTQFRDDMAFRSHPEWTLPTLTLHWMLSASAFQFLIPSRRIRDGGRIWPQFRLHTLCFTTRSVLLITRYWYELKHDLEPSYTWNWALVMLGMLAADTVTWAIGDNYASNSVRETDAPGYVKFAFSVMQFNATAVLLFGVRRASLPFVTMYVVQLTPFIGTLRRKNLFKSNFWGGFAYGAFIACGLANQYYQLTDAGGHRLHLTVRCIGLLATFLRLNPFSPSFLWPLQNKFVIWTIMHLLSERIRPSVPELDVIKVGLVTVLLLSLVVVSGFCKCKNGYYPANVVAAKMNRFKAE